MRYGVFEFHFKNNEPVFCWAGRDLSRSSASDLRNAWGYQASYKGGYMEAIEDTEEAFERRKAEALKFHPRCRK